MDMLKEEELEIGDLFLVIWEKTDGTKTTYIEKVKDISFDGEITNSILYSSDKTDLSPTITYPNFEHMLASCYKVEKIKENSLLYNLYF